jgi:hypothetical protein
MAFDTSGTLRGIISCVAHFGGIFFCSRESFVLPSQICRSFVTFATLNQGGQTSYDQYYFSGWSGTAI